MKISKRLLCALIAAVIVATAAVIPVSAAQKKQVKKTDSPKANYVEGEAIVVLKDSVDKSYSVKSKAAVSYGAGISMKESFTIDADGGDGVKMAVLKSSKLSTKQLITSLKKNSAVKYAFPNHIRKVSSITNDPYSKYQWALENTGQNGGIEGKDVKASALWDKAAQSDKETVVAVIDTGFDFNHEDLQGVVWTNPYGSKLIGKNGFDLTYTVAGGKPQDDNGHGTHVSGIIAGVADNEKGISGINKSNVKILPLKVFDANGYGYGDAEFQAYDYIARAVKLGANIKSVNCSFGGDGTKDEKLAYDEIFDELGASGVVTAVAAGNEFLDLENPYPDEYEEDIYILPATTDSKYCMTVAAGDENDGLAEFSNYSEKYVDVAAPGNDILSTVSYNCYNPSIYNEEQQAELTSAIQNYDSGISAGDFGYPVVSPVDSTDYHVLHDATVSSSDVSFGESGKSAAITFNEETSGNDDVYVVEIPFTIDNPDEPYRISFMASCNVKMMNGVAVDVPQSMACYYDGSYYTEETDLYPTRGTWDHYEITINPSKTEKYLKSTERKLTLGLGAKKGDTLYIDDFAVSKQGADADKFGKYDFYSGTSMATPYVAGAAALVANCNPEAKPIDVVNMICNTGRVSDALTGKVAGARSLSLDNTDKVPPVITSVNYSADGKNIEINGSTNNASTVKVDGAEVTPSSVAADKVVIPDNNYNTKKITVSLTNEYGTDTLTSFVSHKPVFPTTTKVIGAPESTNELIPVMAGDKAYFVNSYSGVVDKLSYKISSDKYNYEFAGYINLSALSTEKSDYNITSAAYSNNKIYFTAVDSVRSSFGGIIGFENIFACYDISKKQTTVLCEIPNVPVNGAALAAYKGGLYIIGGYDIVEKTFCDTVYKYNSATSSFEEMAAKLPEGRGYAQFVVCGDKLVGMYGADASGKMPSPLVFDGSAWTKSAVEFNSDDGLAFDTSTDGKDYYYYGGNVGLGENGVFCNGSYVYGLGDTFTYNPSNDSVTASAYSMMNSLSDGKIFGTTIPGCFIGFTADKAIIDYDDDDDDDDDLYTKSAMSYDDDDDDDYPESTKTAYLLPLNNTNSDPAKQTYITLKKSSASLYVKGTYKIKATVRNPKGKTTYKSSNAKVAKVSSSGKITALKKGTAKITVKNNGVKKTFTVTVKNPKLNASSKTLKKGKSFTLKITGKIGKAKFTTSNKKVATVTSGGKVKAVSKGKAVITVTTNGVKLKCKITVK
ncbi:MAG: S8 family serine peptidase [Ruminococcus sp.]|nr:S8 family serine peptidase [Ruminococcus sp.]